MIMFAGALERVVQVVEQVEAQACAKERARCVGLLLEASGTARIARDSRLANVLDEIATKLEHPELTGTPRGTRCQ